MAIHAVAPVCTLIVVYGLFRAILALSRNDLLIPLEAIGALLVLTRPHGSEILPDVTAEDQNRVSIAAVSLAVTSLVGLLLPLS